MRVIDADAHVIETEQTWSFRLEEDRRFAPELLVSTKNSIEFWRIDDRVFTNSNLGLKCSRGVPRLDGRCRTVRSYGFTRHVLSRFAQKSAISLSPACCATTASTSPARLRMISPTSWSTPGKIISWSAPTTATPITPTILRLSKHSPMAAESARPWGKRF